MARKTAKKPAAKPKKPSEAKLEPFKIVGQLVGARKNEHGEIVSEEPMGEVQIYAANFDKVKHNVDLAVKRLREQERIIEETKADEDQV